MGRLMSAYPDGTLWRSKIDGTNKQQLTFQPFTVHLAPMVSGWKLDSLRWLQGRQNKEDLYDFGSGRQPRGDVPGSLRQADPSWSARR